MSDDPRGWSTLLARAAARGVPRGRHRHHGRQLRGRRDRHRDRARERGQRPPRLLAAALPRRARGHRARRSRRLADAAFMIEQLALAAVGRELPSYVSWLAGPARRRRRRPRGVRRRRARQRPLGASARATSARSSTASAAAPASTPARSTPGRRPRLRLGLLGPDRRGADAAAARHAPDEGRKLPSPRRSAARAPRRARWASRCTTCWCATARRRPRRPARRAASAPPGAPGRARGRARGSTAPRRGPELAGAVRTRLRTRREVAGWPG